MIRLTLALLFLYVHALPYGQDQIYVRVVDQAPVVDGLLDPIWYGVAAKMTPTALDKPTLRFDDRSKAVSLNEEMYGQMPHELEVSQTGEKATLLTAIHKQSGEYSLYMFFIVRKDNLA